MLQQMPLSCIYLETNALLNSFRAIDFSVIAAAQHNNPELRNWKSLSCASTRYNNHTHLEPPTLSSQLPSDVRCTIPSILCHTPVSMPPTSSSLCVLSGQGSTKMFGCGPEHVHSVSTPKCIDILSHPYQPLEALTFALTTSTSLLQRIHISAHLH